MFLVSDSVEDRRKKIIFFLDNGEISIAVLLAAANFEWTLRRSIIGLGTSKTSAFNQKNGVFYGCHGFKDYKRVWKTEVTQNVNIDLADVVPEWKYFKEEAFALRHRLIHGTGAPRVRIMVVTG
jgi:hypothetical protein